MRYIIAFVLLLCPVTASAKFLSVSDRVDIVNQQVKGNNSYQACLARKLADFASEELSQHDLRAAQAFIKMAEEAATRAGGGK